MFKDMIQRWKNTIKVTKQLREGKWESGKIIMDNGTPFDLVYKGQELWVANGPLFCNIDGKGNVFGLVGRHVVWYFGVKRVLKKSVYTVKE